MTSLTSSPTWKALAAHHASVAPLHLRDLFASDPQRFSRFSVSACDLLLDYSKNRITADTLRLLCDLACQADVRDWTDRMFRGDRINTTENRAVLHIALRNRSNRPILVDGHDVMPGVNAVLAKLKVFSESVRTGRWLGWTGKPVTDIVNIGIGGSGLGPVMACGALRPYGQPGLTSHFVSNVDGTHLMGDKRFLIKTCGCRKAPDCRFSLL